MWFHNPVLRSALYKWIQLDSKFKDVQGVTKEGNYYSVVHVIEWISIDLLQILPPHLLGLPTHVGHLDGNAGCGTVD